MPSPIPGVVVIRVVPFLVLSSTYLGGAVIALAPGGPAPTPSFLTGGRGFTIATMVDSQRTQGEPLVYVDQSGNIWETAPWGFSTAQGFVSKSTDQGASFHIVSPNGLRPNPAPGGGGDSDIITDDHGNAYFADLEGLANVGVAVTNEGGKYWRVYYLTYYYSIEDYK